MERFVRLSLSWMALLCLSFTSVATSNELPVFDEASLEFFEKEVRPILVARCFECHSGATKGTPRGGLRLDSRDALLKGGDTGPGVTLDKPADSLFISSINYGDIYQMPPKSKLPPDEIATLTRWVEMGLPWPKEAVAAGTVKPFDLAERTAEHWCWQSIKPVQPPSVVDATWPISNADRFILAKLESSGLRPAPPADKRTLLRRVYFDLIGLPPSPEEVERFANDPNPQALEAVVDQLLGSVHFGERWGRHWLDLARYAETRGHEFEPVIPNAWQFRDYVIRAFNADVPFDRFLTEQIAGDLLEPRWRADSKQTSSPRLPINESVLGTAFWFLGEEVHSPVDIRKDETDRIDNRLDVMTKTFLGLTVSCARCHDHKFDAISQRDYYALAGFVMSGSYRQVRVDTAEQHHQIALKLEELRTNQRREMASALLKNANPTLDKLEAYWLTALQALDESASIPAIAGDPAKLTSGSELIQRLAADKGLNAALVAKWCHELSLAKAAAGHPLHGLFARATTAPVDGNSVGAAGSRDAAATVANESTPGLVVDFGDPEFNALLQDGVSFGLRPTSRGRLVTKGTPDKPILEVTRTGGWERDLFWKNNKLAPGTEVDNGPLGSWQMGGRMVRSPEFTLDKRHVWYLVKGSVRAYASVNSHLIVVGPLHGSVFREYKHADDEWHWVSHDLGAYTGHRMHVEFSPADEGPCTIAMVVASDEQPRLPDENAVGQDPRLAMGATVNERTVASAAAVRHAVQTVLNETTGKPAASSDAAHVQSDIRTQARLANWFVTHPSLFSLDEIKLPQTNLAEAEAELAKQVHWESTLAPAMLDSNGVDEWLLIRGNSNTPKEPVARRFLEALHNDAVASSSNTGTATVATLTGSGRKELADEMLRSPLVPRVAVNRIWHHLFGRGIVPSVDNLGVLGLPPSHPELLDYLGTQFAQSGWSTKGLIRSLILSRTYQMSSHPNDADAVDPNNELWHRMPIKRLQGEVIRDSLLAVSGRLDSTPYGPSIPIHLTEFMQGRGRPGASGPLDGNGRRSIYISVRRNFLSPMMLAFDTPSPFSTVGRRTVSNVPAQALILMNDPFVIEQANRWAEHLLSDPSQTTDQRLDRLYLTAFARHPTAAELSEATGFLKSQAADTAEHRRSAWNNLCHVMFNVKEFVFVE